MGIEPTEHASQHVPPVLKTGPVTRSGRATVSEASRFPRTSIAKTERRARQSVEHAMADDGAGEGKGPLGVVAAADPSSLAACPDPAAAQIAIPRARKRLRPSAALPAADRRSTFRPRPTALSGAG